MTTPFNPAEPTLAAVLDDLRTRVDSLERWQASTPDVRHRVAALFTSFPSPLWVPAGPWTVDTLRARIPSAAATDTTFTLARNGTDLLSVTVPAGSVRAASAVDPPVSVDVYDTVQVYRSGGAATGTVQALGSSTMPDTPSLGGDGSELPAGRLRSTSTTTTVASGASACVELDYADFTVGGMTYDTGASSRLVIPVDGIYTASAQVMALYADGYSQMTDFTASQQSNPTDDAYFLGFETFSSSTWWTASPAATNPYSATYQVMAAAFDGTASIQGQVAFDNNGAGYGNSVRVVLKIDGAEIPSTSVTYDLDDAGNYPAFVWTCNLEHAIADTATLGIWMEWTDGGSTTGHADVNTEGGQYPIYLQATRVDPPPEVECALVISDSGDNYVDTIAVSDSPVRVASCTSSAFEAYAGDYVELWAFNPSTNSDVVIATNLDTTDTIHSWLYGTVNRVANTEMQVGWIAAGTGTRPGGGES